MKRKMSEGELTVGTIYQDEEGNPQYELHQASAEEVKQYNRDHSLVRKTGRGAKAVAKGILLTPFILIKFVWKLIWNLFGALILSFISGAFWFWFIGVLDGLIRLHKFVFLGYFANSNTFSYVSKSYPNLSQFLLSFLTHPFLLILVLLVVGITLFLIIGAIYSSIVSIFPKLEDKTGGIFSNVGLAAAGVISVFAFMGIGLARVASKG
ncbi:MAG: hypothetical protein LBI43_06820 [Streptococcaceae bacterium]|jgi:hypothetical protein|nr:hypothetical protein [Streptococcaceae bacterium]